MNCMIRRQSLFALLALSFGIPPAFALTTDEVMKLLASDGANNDHVGYSVALSGDTALIGAPRKLNPIPPDRDGAAYVFVRNTGGAVCSETGTVDDWCQQAKLVASDAANADRFGWWVGLSGDTAVIGARQNDELASNSGAAYVFVRSGTNWSEQAKLTASDGAAFDLFGTSVSVTGDTAVIGAGEADGLALNSGKAYVFTRSGSVWSEQAILTSSDPDSGDLFGHHVSISGNTILASAFQDDEMGVDAGAAYIFTRNLAAVPCPETATVDPWCQQVKLFASDAAAGAWFGARVSLSGDTAMVGAPHAAGLVADAGAAYMFRRSGDAWPEQQKLSASDGVAGDAFGFGGAVSGNLAVISADGVLTNTGSAYVYTRSGTVWSEKAKLTASDGISRDFFGWNVGVTNDTALLGAPRPFFDFPPSPGAAYIFNIDRSETPTGSGVEVTPVPVDGSGQPIEDAPAISLGFDEVTGTGETTVTLAGEGPPPPDGFGVLGAGGSTYLDIETTATFEGGVEICIDYSGFTLTGDPSTLSLEHYVDGEWVDITTSNDVLNMILCGVTGSFSFFAVFEVTDPFLLIDELQASIDDLDAKNGVIRSLTSILTSAVKKLTDGNPNTDMAAADKLAGDFIDTVESFRGNQLSDEEADALIGQALAILALLL